MSNSIEKHRVAIQHSLDETKTSLERNELGQFATPKGLADSIVIAALSYLNKKNRLRFLEPSIGTGSFYSALIDHTSKDQIEKASGYEIDEHYGLPSIDLWKNTKLNYIVGDFFNYTPPTNEENKYNLIISNPPYVRHHHLKNGLKDKLYNMVFETFGLAFSKLSGLYCYFLSLTARWLQKEGISVWLIPGEFLDVNYGKYVKDFLLNKVKLLRIHRFNPEALQFSDALVTSVVVFYSTGTTIGNVEFSSGADINNPAVQNLIEANDLHPGDKWSSWFFNTKSKIKPLKTIGDYFCVKRGLATGSNKHFILNKQQIIDLEIPKEFYKPILPSPRYVETGVITQNKDGLIIGIKELYLLDITCAENELLKYSQKFQAYLVRVKMEIGDNYLISKRKPWYRQEVRPLCPFMLTYMGRNIKEPFRLFLNLANATATNGYLLLYPKFNWKMIEEENPGFLQKLYKELLDIKNSTFTDSGRVYGGGLFKMEPKELMNTPIDNILSNEVQNLISSKTEKVYQLSLFERLEYEYTNNGENCLEVAST